MTKERLQLDTHTNDKLQTLAYEKHDKRGDQRVNNGLISRFMIIIIVMRETTPIKNNNNSMVCRKISLI